jgi:hypothetical protein
VLIIAQEIVPGVWVYKVPIRSGETGAICKRCGRWHWYVTFKPPDWLEREDIYEDLDREPLWPHVRQYCNRVSEELLERVRAARRKKDQSDD